MVRSQTQTPLCVWQAWTYGNPKPFKLRREA